MVFHLVSKTETPPPPASKPSMASTFSAKSQSLHNFPLSNLKWSMNQSNTQRLRRIPDPTHLCPVHHSEHRPVSPLKNDHQRSTRKHIDSGRGPELQSSSASLGKNEHRFIKLSYPTTNSSGSGNSGRDDLVNDGLKRTEHLIEKEEKSDGTVGVVEKKEEQLKGSDGKSKIFIRIPVRSKAARVDSIDAVDEAHCAVEEEEPVAKTWNLRPRRAVTKPKTANANGGAPRSGGAAAPESKTQPQSQPELPAVLAVPDEKIAQKKQKLSISLLKEEIEDDFLLMTGSRPPRRPKKRARIVQKQLDGLFPGLWLASVTPDLYRVPDAPLKG